MAENAKIGSKTSFTTRSAGNLPLNMTENAEIGNGISFITRLAKNLSSWVDMAKDAEVARDGSSNNNANNETVEKSFFKKLSRSTR